MSESIKLRMSALAVKRDARELRKLFEATRTELGNFRTLSTELRTDHATTKTYLDNLKTLTTELHADHATIKTYLDNLKTLTTELHADHATMKTYLDNSKALLNQLRTAYLNRLFSGYPQFVIDTNFDIKNTNAYQIVVNGVVYNIAANTSHDTGTTATFPTTKWGVALLSVDNDATAYVDWDTNSEAGYDDEATAIAAISGITPSGEVVVGYVTVEAHATGAFLAGTDALESGTGGDVANATNYYNAINPDALLVGGAVADTVATLSASAVTTTLDTLAAAAVTTTLASITATAVSEALAE